MITKGFVVVLYAILYSKIPFTGKKQIFAIWRQSGTVIPEMWIYEGAYIFWRSEFPFHIATAKNIIVAISIGAAIYAYQ